MALFKEYLNNFKSHKFPAKKPEQSKATSANSEVFKSLVGTQLEIIADRMRYLDEFEEIVVHEKKQLEQYHKRLMQNKFKQGLSFSRQGHYSSNHSRNLIKSEL